MDILYIDQKPSMVLGLTVFLGDQKESIVFVGEKKLSHSLADPGKKLQPELFFVRAERRRRVTRYFPKSSISFRRIGKKNHKVQHIPHPLKTSLIQTKLVKASRQGHRPHPKSSELKILSRCFSH